MSSSASGSDHIDHVRSQLPYALVTALIAILTGFIPVGLNLPVWLSLLSGGILIYLVIKWFGKEVSEELVEG